MLLEGKLVKRFFLARRRRLVRYTIVAAIAAVSLGVAGLIVAQSASRGFRSSLKEKLLANTPHIRIHNENAIHIEPDIFGMINQIAGVDSILGTSDEPAIIVGSDAGSSAILRADNSSAETLYSKPAVSIGKELGQRIGISKTGSADIVVLGKNGESRTIQTLVVDTFSTGFGDLDSMLVRTSPENFAAIIGDDVFRPQTLEVSVKDLDQSAAVAESIRKVLPDGYRVLDWREANRTLFAALETEQRAATFVLSILLIVAVVNVGSTVALLVQESRSDIAVLRTLGMSARRVALTFLIEGLVVSVCGILLGVLLGIATCKIVNHLGLINLPVEVYPVGTVTLEPTMMEVLTSVVGALLLCTAAALVPSIAASRSKPMENLRNA